jgi:hypothetical protein
MFTYLFCCMLCIQLVQQRFTSIKIYMYIQHNDQKKKDKQRSTKHTHKIKERATQTPLKTGDELRWFRCVSNSCSIGGTHHQTLLAYKKCKILYWFYRLLACTEHSPVL